MSHPCSLSIHHHPSISRSFLLLGSDHRETGQATVKLIELLRVVLQLIEHSLHLILTCLVRRILHLLNGQCLVPRNPVQVTLVVHVEDVRLNARHLGRILRHQVHNVEDVVPQIVILRHMPVKATFTELVKDEPVLVADKTDILSVHLQELLLLSHLGKGVNDDTE